MLSIVIPTFNREKTLERTIGVLLPQLRDDVEIIILDNASSTNLEKYLGENDLLNLNINVFRNIINIGAAANITKCFEMARNEYIWLLSDDDIPLENSINTIIKSIKENAGAGFINFSSHWQKRDQMTIGKGINNFIDMLDSYSNIVFMSTNVYNRNLMLKELYYGYTFSYSMAPHLAMTLMMLNNSGCSFVLSNEMIVKWTNATIDNSWSTIRYQIVIKSLLELPLDINNKKFNKLFNILPNRSVCGAAFDIFVLSNRNDRHTSYYNNLFKQFIFRNKRITIFNIFIYLLMKIINNKYCRKIVYLLFGHFISRIEKKRKIVDIFNRF